jgi:beta-galactosidase
MMALHPPRSTIAALLSLLLLAAALPTHARDARTVVALRDGWRFYYTGAPVEPTRMIGTSVDEGDWIKVALPHTWNHLGEYRLTRSADVDDAQGEGWYRLRLEAARIPPGARHYLQFDGVGNVADVWVNGVHVGRHAGAFSLFRVDVTDALHADAVNEIVVRADNSKPAPGSPTQDVLPLAGDFFIHGGIYRGVSLIGIAPLHLDLLDYGGPGVYATATRIERDAADIDVLARVRNDEGSAREATLDIEIRDAHGMVAARGERALQVGARTNAEATLSIPLPHPHRWDGRSDPYLYRIVATLRDGRRTLDEVTQTFGVRSFHVDPDHGFFLNGRHLSLHGVSRHQDWQGKGWAIGDADQERDMALIEEIGANTVRFAHYEHAPAWFDAADRAGMVVWAEFPFVDKVSFGDAAASPALIDNARQQLIELIRQNFNHPSVATWGIGNEVDLAMASGKLGPNADPRPLLRVLDDLAHHEDPNRPTALADCCESTPGDKPAGFPILAGITDLIGYNRYFGWYYGKVDELGPHLDALHAAHPHTPIAVTEYGAGGALSQHTDEPRGGTVAPSARPHPEEFQSAWHEQTWPQLARRPYLWATWVWNMFDFASAIRHEGDAVDLNDKGLVTYDRKVKKDAFFFYKAHWSSEPVVHINGRRYVHRAQAVVDVRLYSNAERVRIALNGRTLADVACPDRVCVLHDVRLAPGRNRVTAQARFGARTIEDAVTWDAPDSAKPAAPPP